MQLDAAVDDLALQVGRPAFAPAASAAVSSPATSAVRHASMWLRAACVLVTSSASAKRLAWKLPIGVPNAVRSLT